MKKLLLMPLLLLIATAHAQKFPFLIDINAGYSRSIVNVQNEQWINGLGFGVKYEGGSGMFIGAGMGGTGIKRPAFRLGIGGQAFRMKITRVTHTFIKHEPVVITNTTNEFERYMYLSNSVFFAPVFSKIRVLVSLGVSVNTESFRGIRMYGAAEFTAGVGYKGVMLTAAYLHALNSMYPGYYEDDYFGMRFPLRRRINVVQIGIAITPQLF